jgi:hypothetical protein
LHSSAAAAAVQQRSYCTFLMFIYSTSIYVYQHPHLLNSATLLLLLVLLLLPSNSATTAPS